MHAFISDIWDWWSRIILAMAPTRGASLRQTSVARLRRDAVEVMRDGEPVSIPLGDLQSGLAAMRRGRKGLRGPVTLLLDEDRYVTRPLSPVSVPLSRRRKMAELDMAASTPFNVDEVAIVLPETSGGRSNYHIVRTGIVAPVIRAFNAARLPVRDIVLARDTDAVISLLPRDRAALLGRSRSLAVRRTATASAAAVVFLAAAGTFAHAWVRYDQALAEVSTRNGPLEARARQVREALNERETRMAVLGSLREKVAESRTATETWEEISRVLPDNAWLTDMTVTADTVRLTGFARPAAAIVAPLEGSSMFDKVEFTAPVVRVPGQPGQRFTLQMEFAKP